MYNTKYVSQHAKATRIPLTLGVNGPLYNWTASSFQSANSYHFFLDTVLTIVIIHNLLVFFWRGTWTAMDLLLYPDDFKHSAIVSLGVGCCLAVLLYVFQFKVASVCKKVDKCKKSLLEVFFRKFTFSRLY